jgi:hypothetical protein
MDKIVALRVDAAFDLAVTPGGVHLAPVAHDAGHACPDIPFEVVEQQAHTVLEGADAMVVVEFASRTVAAPGLRARSRN